MATSIIFILLLIPITFSQTTPEPTRVNCDDDLQADILIAVDTSCYMTVSECLEQQTLVSQVFTALRGFATSVKGGRTMFNQRIAYIEFGSDSTLIKPFDEGHPLDLFWNSYNAGNAANPIYTPAEAAAITTAYYEDIRDRGDISCNNNTRLGNPNLHGLLTEALSYGLFYLGNSDNYNNWKYILIFSNCGIIDSEIPSICNEFEGEISPSEPDYPQYIVNMINLRSSVQNPTDPYYISHPNEYISCLVQCVNDERIFADTLPNIDMDTIIDGIQNSLCVELLPIHTCPPTTTSEPTTTITTTIESTDYTTTTESTTTESTTTESTMTDSTMTETTELTTTESTKHSTTAEVTVVCGDNKNSGPGKEIQCTSDEDCCEGFSCRTKDGPKKGKCGRDKNKRRKHGHSSKHSSSKSERQRDPAENKKKYSSKQYDNALVNEKQESESSSAGNNIGNSNIRWILLLVSVCVISCLMLICLVLVCYKHISAAKKNYDEVPNHLTNDKDQNNKVSISSE